jgi:hypothetical protein
VDAGVAAAWHVARALEGVLGQYTRRKQLVTDLLAATKQAADNEASLSKQLTCGGATQRGY